MATTNTTDGGLRTGSVGLPTAISATFGLILLFNELVRIVFGPQPLYLALPDALDFAHFSPGASSVLPFHGNTKAA